MEPLTRTFVVQHGSSRFYRVADQDAYSVLEEVWEGAKLLNVRSHGTYNNPQDANLHKERLAAEYWQ